MKLTNTAKLVIPSKSTNEAFARNAVAMFAAGADPTVSEVADVKTAVSEAVTNCIVHAYQNTIGNIYITLKLFDDETLVVAVSDRGCGIENVKQALEPMFTTSPKEERAGLGFAVMAAFCDKLKVTSKIGRGTKVTLTKVFKKR